MKNERNELSTSEELYRTIFERSSDAIFFLDKTNGKYINANKAAEKLSGYSIEEIKTKSIFDLSPDGAAKHFSKLKNMNQSMAVGEVEYLRSDGTTRLAQMTVVPHRDNIVIGIAHDMTEYKATEKALKESLSMSTAVNEILKVVNSSNNLSDIYCDIHKAISSVIDTTNIFIALYDKNNHRITFPYFIDTRDDVKDIVKSVNADNKDSLTGLIIKKGISVFYNKEALNRHYVGKDERILGSMSQIFLGVPLKVKESVIGAIAVQSYTDPNLYTEQDLKFLETVSEAIAPAFERMMTTALLAENEMTRRKLTTAIEQSPVSVVITDFKGDIEYVNPFFSKNTGYSSKETIGQNPRILKSGLQGNDYYKALWETIIKGDIWTGEFQNKAKDGRIFWERATIGPIYDQANTITHFISIKEDITEFREAQEKLKYIHNMYRTAIRNSKGAVYIYNYQLDKYEYMDDLIFDFFEMKDKEFSPELLRSSIESRQITDPEHKTMPVLDYGQAFIEGQVDRYSADFCIKVKEDKHKWLFDCSLPFEKDKKGKVIKSLGILQDITERVNAEGNRTLLEEQLRQSQKLEGIGQLAGGIAHDFNNILTASIGFTEMLLIESEKNSLSEMAALQLQKVNERARNLVRQLLAFSRKEVYSPRQIQIDEILSDLNKMLSRLIGEDIDIKMDLNSESHSILADPSQIEQIIINLCVNSRDAIKQKGDSATDRSIYIGTRFLQKDEKDASQEIDILPGEYICISVKDSGIGMDEKTRKRIFDPFFTTKEVGKGTGLGLSMVYGIIKQNKGYIVATSEIGKGSLIQIYWPAKINTIDQSVSEKEETELYVGKEHILFVEDDDMVRDVTVRSLISMGYQVTEAENGVHALEKISESKEKFDLIITDLTMPKMNGRTLVKKVLSNCPEVKVIYCSGYSEEIAANDGLIEDDFPLLSKPFTILELTKTIRETMDGGNKKE